MDEHGGSSTEQERSGNCGNDSNPMESDPGKMFIGGLHSQTTHEALQHYFEKYGEVKESVVMRDSVTKRSRGFGFIRFSDAKSVDQVQNCCPHTIDGKKVDPKRAIPKRPPPGQNQYKKVFVGGLPPDTTAQDVTDYFETYGKVREVLLMHDRTTRRLRGFGFVTFESDAAGKHVVETGFHKLKGKSVECKRAQPKEVMMMQVNLTPFPFGRGYHNGLPTTPISFGFPDWAYNPQIYQQLANAMHFSGSGAGRGRGYTTNYAQQGFINMPDHRRYTQEYTQPTNAPSSRHLNQRVEGATDGTSQDFHDQQTTYNTQVQLATYSQHPQTPASPLSQAFLHPHQTSTQTTSPGATELHHGYLTSTRADALYHNGHPPQAPSPQAPFGMPQITLRH